MQANFKGLVRLHTLPTKEPLLPMYEAIINSIQSIEELGIENGRIKIRIERGNQISFANQWETDIDNIIIEDNGIGFTDNHFDSFNTYATEYKIEKGCKGVGRIMWLKAFESATVSSVFQKNNKKYRREFKFDSNKEVYDQKIIEVDNNTPNKTTIHLNHMFEKYKKSNCPKRLDTIAREILNHCFAYYVFDKVPEILISDEKDTINLNQLYKENIKKNVSTKKLNIEGTEFVLIHSKNYLSGKNKHGINFCAHDRVVLVNTLSKVINNIPNILEDGQGEYTYNAYILSDYLDNHVNRERTNFNLDIEGNLFDNIGLEDILKEIKPIIEDYLIESINKGRNKKEEFLRNYIYTKNPRYRILLNNYPELINNIPWTTDEEKLDIELFKQEQEYKLSLKKEGKQLQKELSKDIRDYKKYTDKTAKYVAKLSEIGKGNLADYVMNRKVVLDTLDDNLQSMDDAHKKYAYEKNIHELIFPMTKTSDDIDYLRHNLWVIDEKLSYHHYLASDRKLKSMPEIKTESAKEPDIIIFDSPFAFSDQEEQPYRNLTIIEFKRPGRTNYSNEDNPIDQIITYMEDITGGKIKDKNGRYIDDTSDVRFYCYILCDLDSTIKVQAKRNDFKLTPDKLGFYRYYDNYNAYMEIISYTKLIKDSKLRNKILFDKLFNQI